MNIAFAIIGFTLWAYTVPQFYGWYLKYPLDIPTDEFQRRLKTVSFSISLCIFASAWMFISVDRSTTYLEKIIWSAIMVYLLYPAKLGLVSDLKAIKNKIPYGQYLAAEGSMQPSRRSLFVKSVLTGFVVGSLAFHAYGYNPYFGWTFAPTGPVCYWAKHCCRTSVELRRDPEY